MNIMSGMCQSLFLFILIILVQPLFLLMNMQYTLHHVLIPTES